MKKIRLDDCRENIPFSRVACRWEMGISMVHFCLFIAATTMY